MRFDIESVPSTEEEIAAVASLEFLGYPCDAFLANNPRFINHPVIPTRLCGCEDKACRTKPYTQDCPNITSEKAEWLTATNPYYRSRRTSTDNGGDALIAVLDECIQDTEELRAEDDYQEIRVESLSLPETADVPELDGNPTFLPEEDIVESEESEMETHGFHLIEDEEDAEQ